MSAATSGPAPHLPIRAETGNAWPLVLGAGLASTAVALAAVWALSAHAGENVMGWYANYVLPVGAILVGMAASSGFGLSSWATGTKITGALLAGVALVLLAGYWAAQVIEFRVAFPGGAKLDDGSAVSFFDWYDAVTRSFAWKERDKLGAPLGAWGYLLRAGEIVGFCGGGLLAPLLLRKVPYCPSCQVYMRQPVVALIPAGVALRKVSKKDAAGLAAQEAEARQAYGRGEEALAKVLAAGQTGDAAAFAAAVAAAGPLSAQRAANKLPARIQVRLVRCRRCGTGELRAALVTGRGNQIKISPLRTLPLERGVAPRLAGRG
jgi:hypothetical protein